jgi:hypothetical protein
VVVVAEDVFSTERGELERLQLPVLLLGEREGATQQHLGPRVVRLRSAATPEAILDALRDLGE